MAIRNSSRRAHDACLASSPACAMASGPGLRRAQTVRLDCLRPVSAYRVAFGPRARQKVFTVQSAMPRDAAITQTPCADVQGFSLQSAVRCGADERQRLEQLSR